MINTFNALVPEKEDNAESENISQMAENNTTVDFAAIINRLNGLENAIRELQNSTKNETDNEKPKEDFPINGKDKESEDTENDS